ncbi:hypothetical protein FSARC_1361 [Fusarium sarcochroum]|uniref:Uncharacterized protein n=1 Tax=Fusarium sarcochroum TaxID=1208366 RepID=A0A8H4U8Q8_9HYPO|nr:hypothetical protein FSARC_1361 [Fusarium sarcochroum]
MNTSNTNLLPQETTGPAGRSLQMPPIRPKVSVKSRHSHHDIKSSDIPPVRDLQRALGFGNKGNSENAKFKKAVKEYIDSTKTKDSTPGSSLTKWRNRFERDELHDMARGFLKQKGLDFWPDGPTDSDTQLYRHSRDHEKLVSLLAQLFFRVNTQSKQTLAHQQAALRKSGFSNSLNQSSSSPIQNSPTTSQIRVEGSSDPTSSPAYHLPDRSPSEETDLYHGPESEDEYIPIKKQRGKRSGAAQSEGHSQLAKIPMLDENDIRDRFEYFTTSQIRFQTQSPDMAGRRVGLDTSVALDLSPEPGIAEDATSDPFGTSPINYDTPDLAFDELDVAIETIEGADGSGRVATGVDVASDISNIGEVKEDTRSPTLDVIRYPEYSGEMNATPLPSLPDAQSAIENAFLPETSPGVDEEIDLQTRQRLISKEQDQPHQNSPQEPGVTINTYESDRENTTTPSFNIDYTVYNDKGEPTAEWHPPRVFFDILFDELLEALPFARPQGLSICLENDFSNRKIQRTARTQARFSAL